MPKECMSEQAVSRVLSPGAVARFGVVTIPLVPLLPTGSSNLPGSSDGPSSDAPLFGLAPGGVYQASAVASRSGELLPHPFTLTGHSTLSKTHPQSPESRGHDNPWIQGEFSGGLSVRRSPFCGTFLPVAGTGCYPAPCPVEPGLSSPRHPISNKDSSSTGLSSTGLVLQKHILVRG